MDSTQISEKHYKLIGVAAGCSWKELRKSYKSKIQKFHPDRYENDSILKFDAEEHIKALNLSFHYFQTYYKKNGHLPSLHPIQNPKIDINTRQEDARAFNFKPEDTQNFFSTPFKKKKKLHSTYKLVFIVAPFIVLAYLITPSNDNKENTFTPKTVNKAIYPSSQDRQRLTIPKNAEKQIDIKKSNGATKSHAYLRDQEKLFSYGSTMGSVIDAQGIPDKSENTVWYYGESTVHFGNGVVISWVTHNDTPLNTTISIQTESYRNSSNKSKPTLRPAQTVRPE